MTADTLLCVAPISATSRCPQTAEPTAAGASPTVDADSVSAGTVIHSSAINGAAIHSRAIVTESTKQYTLRQMLSTAEAWLIWWFGITCIGAGNLLTTNLAQICQAAGAGSAIVPTAVTCFSTGNLLGRLTAMVLARMPPSPSAYP
jgi:hypothetical protein